MNDERNISTRLAKHAAMADPVRLQVIDLLLIGDRSPGELQRTLALPSNLVAHHLQVLEQAGMVVRRRSEADRRRSYVHLLGDAFAGLLPGPVQGARRVLFVCTANSARSQLAAAIWPTISAVPAASAGTHPAERVAEGAVAVAEAHGLRLAGSTPQGLLSVRTPGDFVITVCDSAREELAEAADAHWSVPDPVRVGTEAAFEAAFADISRRIGEIAPRLAATQ